MLGSTFVIVEKICQENSIFEFRDTAFEVINRVATISTQLFSDNKNIIIERIFRVNEFGDIEYLTIVFKNGALALEVCDKY